MSSIYTQIAQELRSLEWYRHVNVYSLLQGSEIHFGQPPALQFLAEHGPCTQSELAKALHVSPASVAVSVGRMQKSGLVEKVSDEQDARRNRISLTEKGVAEVKTLCRTLEHLNRKMCAGFTEAELQEFGTFLKRLTENLETEGTTSLPGPYWEEPEKPKGVHSLEKTF